MTIQDPATSQPKLFLYAMKTNGEKRYALVTSSAHIDFISDTMKAEMAMHGRTVDYALTNFMFMNGTEVQYEELLEGAQHNGT